MNIKRKLAIENDRDKDEAQFGVSRWTIQQIRDNIHELLVICDLQGADVRWDFKILEISYWLKKWKKIHPGRFLYPRAVALVVIELRFPYLRTKKIFMGQNRLIRFTKGEKDMYTFLHEPLETLPPTREADIDTFPNEHTLEGD